MNKIKYIIFLLLLTLNLNIINSTNSGVYFTTYSSPFNDLDDLGSDSAAGGWTSFDKYPRMIGKFDTDEFDDIIGFGGTTSVIYGKKF